MDVTLTLSADSISPFYILLQKGFTVRASVGCSIRTLLCEQLGLEPSYVEERIQTVFLDGKPVDDLDEAIIRDGAVLAMSAAMPGLLGATLRRGSHYALLRDSITYQNDLQSSSIKEGRIVIKLFNLLVNELGPLFLERGIEVMGHDLGGVLKTLISDGTRFKKIEIDNREYDGNEVSDMEWSTEEVRLKLNIL